MISGIKERRILGYLPIDHCSEGYGWIRPSGNEIFVGIPYSYCSDSSIAFIECRENGVVKRTVNAADLSEIEFEIINSTL